jgi:hypothetical protein
MKLDPGSWLKRLRAQKRAVLCAVLPALALASATGMACPATRAAPSAEHGGHGAMATHHAGAHDAQPTAPTQQQTCPHCPLESGAANVGHAACVIDDGQDGGGTAPGKSVVEYPPPPANDWLLPPARAAPLLLAAPIRAALAAAIPLTLRYCSLLI